MTQVITSKGGTYLTLDAPLHVVNVHVHEGKILPMQQGGLLSKEVRMTPFTVVITFLAGVRDGEAKGKLFLDDDELPEMKLDNWRSTYMELSVAATRGNVQEGVFAIKNGWIIHGLTVLGLGRMVSSDLQIDRVTVDGVEVNVSQQSMPEKEEDLGETKNVMVDISGLKLPVGKNFAVSWSMGI